MRDENGVVRSRDELAAENPQLGPFRDVATVAHWIAFRGAVGDVNYPCELDEEVLSRSSDPAAARAEHAAKVKEAEAKHNKWMIGLAALNQAVEREEIVAFGRASSRPVGTSVSTARLLSNHRRPLPAQSVDEHHKIDLFGRIEVLDGVSGFDWLTASNCQTDPFYFDIHFRECDVRRLWPELDGGEPSASAVASQKPQVQVPAFRSRPGDAAIRRWFEGYLKTLPDDTSSIPLYPAWTAARQQGLPTARRQQIQDIIKKITPHRFSTRGAPKGPRKIAAEK